ncbi:MAG: hypothetical protein EOM37_02140 [Proteobacteria bacterium]|nr:hypothetical protein [Pseudomonadota bacterium]
MPKSGVILPLAIPWTAYWILAIEEDWTNKALSLSREKGKKTSMDELRRLFPVKGPLSLQELQAAVATLPLVKTLPIPEAIEAMSRLSSQLMNDTRTRPYPELQALGFWLRAKHITQLVADYLPTPIASLRVPRGVVFQIPPHNVDILFAYNALLSFLCGNITLVRLWTDLTQAQSLFLELLNETFSQELAARLIFISAPRNDAVTNALSSLCDARMLWGGDETTEKLHTLPLPPTAIETRFVDRFSSALIKAAAYLNASREEQDKVIHAFARDIFSFSQMACTSPRQLFWCGTKEDTERARANFYPRLAAHAKSSFSPLDMGDATAKLNADFLAQHDLDLAARQSFEDCLTVLTLVENACLGAFKDVSFGHGLLFDSHIASTLDIACHSARKDQTLTHWGFSPEEITALARSLSSHGYVRYIPVGKSLTYDPIWDGQNLFDILTKLIRVHA